MADNDDREYFRSTLDYGVAELWLPAKMSPEDVADMESLFALIIRRKSRNATLPSDARKSIGLPVASMPSGA